MEENNQRCVVGAKDLLEATVSRVGWFRATMGHNSVELNAVSYQVHTLVTAPLAYHNRTGADLTAWFGQHPLPRKRRQALAQAA